MKLTSLTLAATLLMTTFASAQSAVDSVAAQLSAQGYTVTGVSRSGNTYTVSSQGNGRDRDVTFNAATGEVMSDDYGQGSRGDRDHGGSRDNDRGHDNDHGRGHDNDRGGDSDHGGGHDNDRGGDSDHGDSDRD